VERFGIENCNKFPKFVSGQKVKVLNVASYLYNVLAGVCQLPVPGRQIGSTLSVCECVLTGQGSVPRSTLRLMVVVNFSNFWNVRGAQPELEF
jgi:hypothetical protein